MVIKQSENDIEHMFYDMELSSEHSIILILTCESLKEKLDGCESDGKQRRIIGSRNVD